MGEWVGRERGRGTYHAFLQVTGIRDFDLWDGVGHEVRVCFEDLEVDGFDLAGDCWKFIAQRDQLLKPDGFPGSDYQGDAEMIR